MIATFLNWKGKFNNRERFTKAPGDFGRFCRTTENTRKELSQGETKPIV